MFYFLMMGRKSTMEILYLKTLILKQKLFLMKGIQKLLFLRKKEEKAIKKRMDIEINLL